MADSKVGGTNSYEFQIAAEVNVTHIFIWAPLADPIWFTYEVASITVITGGLRNTQLEQKR
jgi:hypothetical protein